MLPTSHLKWITFSAISFSPRYARWRHVMTGRLIGLTDISHDNFHQIFPVLQPGNQRPWDAVGGCPTKILRSSQNSVDSKKYSVTRIAPQCSDGQRVGWTGFEPGQGQMIYLSSTQPTLSLRLSKTPIHWLQGPISAEIKAAEAYSSSPISN